MTIVINTNAGIKPAFVYPQQFFAGRWLFFREYHFLGVYQLAIYHQRIGICARYHSFRTDGNAATAFAANILPGYFQSLYIVHGYICAVLHAAYIVRYAGFFAERIRRVLVQQAL